MTESEPVDSEAAEQPSAEVSGADNPDPQTSTAEVQEAPAEPLDPLTEAQTKAAALKDQLLRMAADFDNFRKRSRREVEDARAAGREAMLKELLPVFDNLERAMAAAGSAVDVKSFASGIEMVARQFQDTLGRVGIERVESVGHAFDPAVHEAIQHLETADVAAGHIAAEVQPGYRAGQRLIRPAMVVVAKSPPAPPTPTDEPQNGA